MKHKGTKRSHRDDAVIEAAREHARAARIAQGLPADPEDRQPATVQRKYAQLPSGEWWPADEPVPPEVSALEPQLSAWTPRKEATKRKTGR